MRGRKQLYKCKACGRQFVGGRRLDKQQIITDYIEGKQTVAQLELKYGVSHSTICRDLKGMRYVQKISKYKHVVIQMDTTYWGRGFGPGTTIRIDISPILTMAWKGCSPTSNQRLESIVG